MYKYKYQVMLFGLQEGIDQVWSSIRDVATKKHLIVEDTVFTHPDVLECSFKDNTITLEYCNEIGEKQYKAPIKGATDTLVNQGLLDAKIDLVYQLADSKYICTKTHVLDPNSEATDKLKQWFMDTICGISKSNPVHCNLVDLIKDTKEVFQHELGDIRHTDTDIEEIIKILKHNNVYNMSVKQYLNMFDLYKGILDTSKTK